MEKTEFEALNAMLNEVLRRFVESDISLLQDDSSERSIAHKLAEHINEFYQGEYHVDCEYNRDMGNVKKIKILKETYEKFKKAIETDEDYVAISIYPDIIVHHRRQNENNLLVIEIKKTTLKDDEAKEFDLEKLMAYTNYAEGSGTLKYRFGVYLHLIADEKRDDNYLAEQIWFWEGQSEDYWTKTSSQQF